jgi:AraC family transcriptional regulator
MSQLHSELLYRSGLVTIRDVRCRPTDPGCGAEEESGNNNIVFPRRGAFLQHLGRERILATANHALFFQCGRPYRVSHPLPGGDDCTSVTFAPETLQAVIRVHDSSPGEHPESLFRFTHGPLEPATIFRLQNLRKRLLLKKTTPLEIEETALTLLDEVVSGTYQVRGIRPSRHRAGTLGAYRDKVEAVKALLAGPAAAKPSLTEIASAVHASPYHLSRLFRDQVGVSIHQYLNRLRLAWALERLAGGARDLTALALELGFSSHSHFTNSFQRQFGITPSAFRG